MTIGALGSMVGATRIGPINENASWELTFFSFVGMLLLAMLALRLLNIDRQVAQMAELDEEEAESEALLLD